LPLTTTLAILHRSNVISLPSPQSKYLLSKNHFMSVNSNTTASEQNKKKNSVSELYLFIAGVIHTAD
jgi:hypothetical protein